MKKFTSIFASTLLTTSLFGFAGQAQEAFDPTQPKATQNSALNYFNLNEAIQMADAYGALAEGAHGTFGKFPANFNSGEHTHSGAYHGIVLKGTMTNPFEDKADAPELVAGSYWYVPAGMKHSTLCVSDEPCEFFFFADAEFDFLPTQ